MPSTTEYYLENGDNSDHCDHLGEKEGPPNEYVNIAVMLEAKGAGHWDGQNEEGRNLSHLINLSRKKTRSHKSRKKIGRAASAGRSNSK